MKKRKAYGMSIRHLCESYAFTMAIGWRCKGGLIAQANEIMARLNYPKIVTEGNAHADEIKAAWSEYWEGNPPHPNFDWDEMPEHLA